ATDDATPENHNLSLHDALPICNDTDVDIATNGQVLSISGTPTALHGTVTVNVDNTLNYTPNANFNGTDTISYTVSDGNGGTDTSAEDVTADAQYDAKVAVDDTP